ncbi:hypothetical protein GUITHDRAFT_154951 [Guillardia theta CCMP2712]|uniref:Uncharacterized protein n=1 Tax=Guillardia theta (strain CCMP2712) TaxID=905079 RepID=L1IN30_GUITC|nr:hypothetical protein GUITHDRAFT_154951 [Guillardia theta CCMP2712]EKX37502.1 hypothetical protein GUITHDRAFT_154951 [Guillardia theta CCMP2712]|eukprot:XP_005824482.1 hypothetical protein GUITHDRAFT_154951 [Guillardia theta CCMP2712]
MQWWMHHKVTAERGGEEEVVIDKKFQERRMSKEVWEDFFGVKEDQNRKPQRRNSTGELVRIDLEQVWRAAERDRRLLHILYRLNHIEENGIKRHVMDGDMQAFQRNGSARNLIQANLKGMMVSKARRASCPTLQDVSLDFQI